MRGKTCAPVFQRRGARMRGRPTSAHLGPIRKSRGRQTPGVTRETKTPGVLLRLERQGGFAGGTGVDQLDRVQFLGLAVVLEKNQAGFGKRAIAFR